MCQMVNGCQYHLKYHSGLVPAKGSLLFRSGGSFIVYICAPPSVHLFPYFHIFELYRCLSDLMLNE
uniref:Uncharacterized protein n=1 Tax=Arion vulgaris TaxID=1028688 RepID=A0A0B6ZWF9_9EUPU